MHSTPPLDSSSRHPKEHHRLVGTELKEAVAGVGQWQVVQGKLHRRFSFGNFSQAFSFMTQVAMCAEQLDHHPHWRNEYNVVDIYLSTFDADGITWRDIELAKRVDQLCIDD